MLPLPGDAKYIKTKIVHRHFEMLQGRRLINFHWPMSIIDQWKINYCGADKY